MADEDGSTHDRPAMTDKSNQPVPQARPASFNNESTSNSTPSSVLSKSPQHKIPPLPEAAVKSAIPESQPMTTSSSSSSLPPDQHADTAGASPYGTRSRNRTGNPRPNYAEDREQDMEYEWSSGKKSHSASGSALSNNYPSVDSERASTGNTRRSSATAPNGTVPNTKAPIPFVQSTIMPGMSSFSAYPDPNVAPVPSAPSRKRKAPGNAPLSGQPSSTMAQTAVSNLSRRNVGPSPTSRLRPTNLMTFENCQGYLKNGKLKADDGTVLAVNDQVYLICEPPGEPYYLARIMEFLHVDNDPNAPVDSLRVNWFLRSRDIPRKVNDTRAVFASMQSDTSPITSLRGKCRILHRNDINDLDAYRKEPNSFWYEKLFDRYIHRFYEVISTSQVINVPAKVKKVLDERWKFVVVEIGRGRELTSAIKTCKRCQLYCASNDSVDCAVCKNTYHMNCVRPPLLKKPARGFGWSCGPCSRRQERKLEARNTPLVGEKVGDGEEEEYIDEEEEEHGTVANTGNGNSSNEADAQGLGPRPPTAEQIAQARLWPFRYLGIHCRVEDALDYDDRIYPRASSRLGPKHQANVQNWHGRPVEFVKPIDVRKKLLKGNSHKKDAKMTKDTIAALEADKSAREKRPKWIMDEPPGYVPRGEDFQNSDVRNTAQLKFRLPEVGEKSSRGHDRAENDAPSQREELIDQYMNQAKPMAVLLGLKEHSTNFLDKALELLVSNDYQTEKALRQLRNVNKRKDLKEPDLSKDEIKKFEEGVMKHGSELKFVSKHVGKTQKHGEIVRFYYMWKKTPRGKQIWGNYEGRKGKKQQKQPDSKLVDDVADDVDDSAFDNGKAAIRKRGFECKFCFTRTSPQWRRAPTTAPGTTVPIDPSLKNSKDKNAHLMLALCQRCAYLWRCYAISWENPDEVAKKVASGGGRAWKRRVDEELLAELTTANVANSIGISTTAAAAAASLGVDIPPSLTIQPGQDGPKKKQKLGLDAPAMVAPQNLVPVEPPKKKVIEKPPEPPLIPEQPRKRILPCAICDEFVAGEEATDEYLCCGRCRLTVHRNCYGVIEERAKEKWNCDMCTNDITHQISTDYYCILCSVREYTDKELMEVPKPSHKKKNDREKEKERLERELLVNATENYYRSQREKGRPEQPRQPLKRTTDNNWVHVVCALFHPEVKFADPKRLEPAEGFGGIASTKFSTRCKLCKKSEGACVNCHQCQAPFHVACAQQFGYQLGFDINPVKGSRTSSVSIVDMHGDRGTATAVVHCKEHAKPTVNGEEKKGIHPMAEFWELSDKPGFNINALQAFARTHKQADVSLTGTLRKALMLDSATSTANQVFNASIGHRGSTSSAASGTMGTNVPAQATRSTRVSPGAVTVKSDEVDQDGDRVVHLDDTAPPVPKSKECFVCDTKVSPKWHVMQPRSRYNHKTSATTMDVEDNIPSPSSNEFSNAHINGTTPDKHQDIQPPSVPLQDEAASAGNVGSGEDIRNEVEIPTAESKPDLISGTVVVNGGHSPHEPQQKGVELPNFLCNRCFQRKRNEPTPPPTPTPVPETGGIEELNQDSAQAEAETQAEVDTQGQSQTHPPTQVQEDTRVQQDLPDPECAAPALVRPLTPETAAPVASPVTLPASASSEPEAASPQRPLVWPSQVAQASAHDPHHGWRSQSMAHAPAPAPAPALPSVAIYHGPERVSNGLPRSPPVVAPPLTQHYPPPLPHHPPSYGPLAQSYRDSRGVLHRGIPPQYHVPHMVNGVAAEPPSFQYRRDSNGNLYQVPYVPPAMRQQQQQQQPPLLTAGLRSPLIRDRSSQGPHGPPEAAENPFAVPSASHSPRRPTFGGVYGSPTGVHERPETPPDGFVRDGRWASEGPLANGASASPSLRNLLH